MSSEFKVGLFVVGGVVILTYILINIGEWPFFGEARQTYPVEASFSNVVGLSRGAEVVLSGVKIGEVESIHLEQQRAIVRMAVYDDVEFSASSMARITSIGLLGQSIVEIVPQEDEIQLTARQAGRIGSLSPVTLDQLVTVIGNIGDDVTEVTRSIRDFLGVEGGKDRIQTMLNNLLEFSEQLDAVVRENRLQVKRSVDSLERLSVVMRDKLPIILDDVQTLSADLKKLVSDRKDDVDDSLGKMRGLIDKLDGAAGTLKNILDKIDKGEGTISKLINEPETLDNVNNLIERADAVITEVQDFVQKPSQLNFNYGFSTNYYGRSEDFKSYYRMTMNFSKRDSFVFELINDRIRYKAPVYQPDDINNRQVDIGDDFTFSATYSRRFLGGRLRMGIIEGYTGAALDMGSANDLLNFTIEGYDFGREEGPHLNVAAHLRIWQGLFFTLGYDDPVDEDRSQIYYGAGYRF